MDVYQEMLRTGCERSVITFSALISACEKAGHWQMALNLFNQMLRERCTPNVITYNSLITACAQVGALVSRMAVRLQAVWYCIGQGGDSKYTATKHTLTGSTGWLL